jgi:hypothetical protein
MIFFGAMLFLFVFRDQLNRWTTETQAIDTYQPVGWLKWFGMPLLSQSTTDILFYVYTVAMVLAFVGLFTRTSALIAGLTGLYLYAIPSMFGKVGHGNMLVLFTTFTFALSRASDVWSFDALIHRNRQVPERSGEYTWPIRVVWLFMTLIFFATGIAKLRWGGIEWVTTPHLGSTMRQHFLLPEGTRPSSDFGLYLAQFDSLMIFTAVMTVFVELFFPLALISKWGRLFFPTVMFCLQFGIGWSLGIFFWTFFVCYLFWLPWELWGRNETAKPA